MDADSDAVKCINSWKKFFPGYEIREWNEDNFDINICAYVKEAYDNKRWAFVSDYARFWILYNYGGLYFDTDVEAIKSFDDILRDGPYIQWFAAKYANAHDVFFVGRGIDYAVSLEGSLKLKEISYIHSEAYAAGELKHGTISLIEQGTLVIGVLTQNELYEKTVSNMLECKSRGAYLMGLTTYGKYEIEDQVNFTVYVPKVDERFIGSLAVIPLQLLGYYVSVAKGLDVDKPRNLAKSVTVE